MDFVGSHGSIKNDLFNTKKIPGLRNWAKLDVQLVDSGDVAHHPCKEQFSDFVGCLEAGTETSTHIGNAFETHRVAFAADKSVETGNPLRLSEVTLWFTETRRSCIFTIGCIALGDSLLLVAADAVAHNPTTLITVEVGSGKSTSLGAAAATLRQIRFLLGDPPRSSMRRTCFAWMSSTSCIPRGPSPRAWSVAATWRT